MEFLPPPPSWGVDGVVAPGTGDNVVDARVEAEVLERAASSDLGRGRKSGLDVHGLPVAVKDLTYTIAPGRSRKEAVVLLQQISVVFQPARMAAVMGASGSGKTTLIDVLAGRTSRGQLQGAVLYAGQKPSRMFLRRHVSYVEQRDTLIDLLTVREMLLYTAELKRPHTESYAEKADAVDYFIKCLALEDCQHTRIGNAFQKGISGGQARRTSIALAMVTLPRVIFLDEPTSGLDSYTANETMLLVKDLAVCEGVTVVATIHSPTPFAFALFHSLVMLMAGRLVYAGPNDDGLLEYFRTGCGIVPRTSMTDAAHVKNVAEFLTDLVVGAEKRKQGHTYAEAYRGSAVKRRADAELEGQLKQAGAQVSAEMRAVLDTTRATVTPSWWGLWTILKYRTRRNYCTPAYLAARLADKTVSALLVMLLYLGVGGDYSPSNLGNLNAFLIMWTVIPSFGATGYIPSIVLERPLFLRERNDGLYTTTTYLVAKMLDELVIAAGASILYAMIVYWPLQLHGSFVVFWLVYLQVLAIGIMLAYLIAALSPTMEVANSALPAYCCTLLFFAGLLLRFEDMPVYLAWYSRIDFMKYAWSALMKNEYGARPPLFQDNANVLETYGLAGVNVSVQLAVLLGFFFAFFAFTATALAFKRYTSR